MALASYLGRAGTGDSSAWQRGGLMRSIVRGTQAVMGKAWCWLRQVSGDAAYENYLRRTRRGEATICAGPPLTREQYYLDVLRRRYTGVGRCC